MSKPKNTIRILLTEKDQSETHLGDFEVPSSKGSSSSGSDHEEFMVASEMNKIFTKEKERIIHTSHLKIEAVKEENRDLKAKLQRIKTKAESAFRGDYRPENYRRIVQ